MAKKVICVLLILVSIYFGNVSFAASWFDEGYEWAKNNEIIGKKTVSQLLTNIPAEDFYSMIFKYFDRNPSEYYASIRYKDDYFKSDNYKSDNYILVAVDRELTKMVAKEWITNDEYKKGITLINNSQNILNKNKKFFSKQEIKDIEYYLKVMKYLLYEKIYDNDYKLTQSVAIPKNGQKFIEYRLIPYYGVITREEFLVLIYKYKIAHTDKVDISKLLGYYTQNNILQGYNNNLMLETKINYAHFVTFLSRM